MTLNVKKGDNVLVIAGKDKGKSGKVLAAIPSDNAVVVSGVNIVAKHQKPKSAQDKGGIVKHENKIDVSNVQIICPVCNKATRVANAFEGDKKYRQCKKCKASLDKEVSTKKEVKKEVKTVKKAEATKEVKEAKSTKTTKTTSTKKTTTKSKAE